MGSEVIAGVFSSEAKGTHHSAFEKKKQQQQQQLKPFLSSREMKFEIRVLKSKLSSRKESFTIDLYNSKNFMNKSKESQRQNVSSLCYQSELQM